MRERMEGLGGMLTIRSAVGGTCVLATLTTPPMQRLRRQHTPTR